MQGTFSICSIHFEIERKIKSKFTQLVKLSFLIFFFFQNIKDKSDTGVRKLFESGELPLERILVESDAPFMYPNTRASKLPQHVKSGITERSQQFLHRLEAFLHFIFTFSRRIRFFKIAFSLYRYCTFQRNEPCSLPAIVEMIAALMGKKPEDVALATAFNALKLFGLSQ